MHIGGPLRYVWVNGQCVWTPPIIGRGHHPDANRLTISLHKGENQIVVFSNWLFYVSLGEI